MHVLYSPLCALSIVFLFFVKYNYLGKSFLMHIAHICDAFSIDKSLSILHN